MPLSARTSLLLVSLLLVGAGGGCRWNEWFTRHTSEPPPILFSQLPTREEAVAAINASSSRVQSLQTQGASVSVPGAPAIGAEIALTRPKNFRFRAGTSLLGPELDMGSNDELFWFWAARAPDGPDVYYARHDAFAGSRARQMLPIEPTWLIEALGVVEIDPSGVIEGPTQAGDGRVQLRTTMQASAGQFTRLIQFDARHGWILEQHLYDPAGQLIASARNSQHEYYKLDGVSLPKRIDVSIPQGGLKFQLDVNQWAINQPPPEGQTLFDLPRQQLASYRFVDMADPNFVPPGGSLPSLSGPQTPAIPQASLPNRYRGWR